MMTITTPVGVNGRSKSGIYGNVAFRKIVCESTQRVESTFDTIYIGGLEAAAEESAEE